MARIQPSFLHFYLFRPRQHNTSFLLTSKNDLKYPGGSFLSNPKLLLSFSIVNGLLYLFICLVNYISPSRTIQNRVHEFLSHQRNRLRFCIYTSLSPIPCFKISSTTQRSDPFYQTPKILKHHSLGTFTTQSDH